MTGAPNEPSTNEPSSKEPSTDESSGLRKDLREEARERIEEMPAETALGNAYAAGGVHSNPEEFAGDDDA